MTPFAVRALLSSPASTAGPIMLDALVLVGMMSQLGAEEGGWIDPAIAADLPLPFATVGKDPWWYAASAALPDGPEVQRHRHRRAPVGAYERYTTRKTIDMATGPDKSQRIPYYIRPAWLSPTWLAIGDPGKVARALYRVPFIGKLGTHGMGWVRAWQLSSGHEVRPLQGIGRCERWHPQVDLEDFRQLRLRHQPATGAPPPGQQVRLHHIPLRPPYHTGHDVDAARQVRCWQVWR